jgi:drug/metabolite transporter (DMT)-like permease
MKNKITAYIEAFIAVFIWGITFVATKATLQEVSPATIVWVRFGIGIIILGVTVALRRQFTLPGLNELAYFALLGFIGVTFHQWLQATGLMTAAATTTAWIVATIPVFTAILGWLVLKEKLGALRLFGIVLAKVISAPWRVVSLAQLVTSSFSSAQSIGQFFLSYHDAGSGLILRH